MARRSQEHFTALSAQATNVHEEAAVLSAAGMIDVVEAGRDAGQGPTVTTTLDFRQERELIRFPARDALEAYLREIGRFALLTAEEEVDLARRMEVGLRAAELSMDAGSLDLDAIVELARRSHAWMTTAEPTPEQAREICRKIQCDGRAAKARLIEANLRLVVSIAKRYRGRGMQLLDLIQEGNLGLIRGVEKFDPSRGFKFSTYATWWIRQAVVRGIANRDRTVRLPVHLVDSINKLRRVQSDLLQDLGRVPGVEDIGERMGMDLDEVRRLLNMSRETVSLDVPLDGQSSARLGDVIEDPEAEQPLDVVCSILLQEQLEIVLRSLPDRDRRVIELRFGLTDGVARTLDQIGSILGLNREHVGRIERRALCKLRHPCASYRLKEFCE